MIPLCPHKAEIHFLHFRERTPETQEQLSVLDPGHITKITGCQYSNPNLVISTLLKMYSTSCIHPGPAPHASGEQAWGYGGRGHVLSPWGSGLQETGPIVLIFPLHPMEGQMKQKTALPLSTLRWRSKHGPWARYEVIVKRRDSRQLSSSLGCRLDPAQYDPMIPDLFLPL